MTTKAANIAQAARLANSDGTIESTTLDGLDSTQFLRSDASDTMTGDLTITSGSLYTNNPVHSKKPYINVDFSRGNTINDPRIQNNRGSEGSYIDRDGVMRFAPPFTNRIDYYWYSTEHYVDGYTTVLGVNPDGQCRGMLAEPAATNYVKYTSNLGDVYSLNGWGKTGSITFSDTNAYNDGVKAPDGTWSATKLEFDPATSGTQYFDWVPSNLLSMPAVNQGDYWTYSIWIKGDPGQVVGIALLIPTGGNIEKYYITTGEWQRISVSKEYNAGETIRVHPLIIRNNPGTPKTAEGGYVGVYAETLYVWGPQLEFGKWPTSNIRCFGTNATRSSDAILINSDHLRHYTKEATWYCESSSYIDYTAANYNSTAIGSSDSSNRYQVRYDDQSGIHAIGYTSGAGSVFAMDTNNFANYSRVALALKTNDFAFSVNGATSLTDTAGSYSTNYDSICLGHWGSSEWLYGHIRKISIWDQRLTNAELENMTEIN
jgi:hypothetical protein